MPYWTKLSVITLCVIFLHLSVITSAVLKIKRVGNRKQYNIKNMNNISPVVLKIGEMHADSFENLMFRRKKSEKNEVKDIFGENGVIYITKPTNVYARMISKLINEIALLKLALKGYAKENKRIATLRGLEQGLNDQFDFNELVL